MRINTNGKELQEFIEEHHVKLESHENGEVILTIWKRMHAVSFIVAEVIGRLKNENKNSKLTASMSMPVEVDPENYEFILSFEERVSI